MIIFFILITYLLDIVLKLYREILSWSLREWKGRGTSGAWLMFYYLCIQSTGTYLIHQFDRDQSCSHLEGGSYATFEGDGHIIYLTLKMVSWSVCTKFITTETWNIFLKYFLVSFMWITSLSKFFFKVL